MQDERKDVNKEKATEMWTKEKKDAREKQIGLKVCISHKKEKDGPHLTRC